MEVILREDVPHLGTIGDIVRVKPGYARNFLLPRGLAVVADKRNLKQLEHERRIVAAQRDRKISAAQVAAGRIGALRLTIKARAGEEGKLYGSVTNIDVERALAESGIDVDRRRIRLEEPIKALGEYRIGVQLQAGVTCEVLIEVSPLEEGE